MSGRKIIAGLEEVLAWTRGETKLRMTMWSRDTGKVTTSYVSFEEHKALFGEIDGELQPSCHQQNDHHNQHDAEHADTAVAVAVAISSERAGDAAEQNQDEENEQNGSE